LKQVYPGFFSDDFFFLLDSLFFFFSAWMLRFFSPLLTGTCPDTLGRMTCPSLLCPDMPRRSFRYFPFFADELPVIGIFFSPPSSIGPARFSFFARDSH